MQNRGTAAETGFTLVELIVVMVIISILITLPIASYLHFTDRANSAVAKGMVREIAPSIEAFYADHTTYTGMTLAGLKTTYDSALDPAVYTLSGLTGSTYCVSSSKGGQSWKKDGPGADIVQGSC